MLISITVTLVVVPAFAVAPFQQFTFQGLLKNSDGTLVTAQRDLTFRIYSKFDAPQVTKGNECLPGTPNFCLWQENQTNIGVINGIFTIPLGNQTSLSPRINFTTALFLEVIVRSTSNQQQNPDQILEPRINLTSAPFALAASRGVGTNATTAFNVTNISAGPTLIVKGGATTDNILNVTAGSLTTGSALNIGSTSGSTSTRNLVNIVNDNTAATGTTILRIKQDSIGTIINVINSTNAEVFKVTDTGLVTVTQLKVNTTGTTLYGIIKASRPAAQVGLGINQITATTTGTFGSGDIAFCSFGSFTGNTAANRIFLQMGNVTNDRIFVNVTSPNTGSPTAFGDINCLVFDVTE